MKKSWLVLAVFLFSLGTARAQSWTQLSPTGGPPSARYEPTAIYDPVTKQMIVFGGTMLGVDTSDLWALSLGASPTWTLLSPAGGPPAPRVGSRAAYDAGNARMMVFGGGLGNTSPCTNEVWVLSNANSVNGTPTWTQLSPSGAAPSPRWVSSSVYDAASNRMTIFGGNNCFSGFSNDVWVLSNANGLGGTPAWTQLAPTGTPPSPSGYHTAVYDPGSNRMIVFGVFDSGSASNQVWVLTNANGLGGTPSWIQLAPGGTAIPPTNNQAAVYDFLSNRMIVFGEENATGDTNQAWVLANANGLGGTPSWSQLNPASAVPPAREGLAAVYDPTSNHMVIFGGVTSGPTYFNDAWILTNANGVTNANSSLLVGNLTDASIKRYDGTTGAFVGNFVAPNAGGLQAPTYFVLGPDGNLYVTDCGATSRDVKRYNGSTGAYIDDFLPAGSGSCYGLAFGRDGNLYVVGQYVAGGPFSVRRYNGSTGAFIDDFVPAGSGSLTSAQGFTFGHDGNLYVADEGNGADVTPAIRRYNGTTGAFIDNFVPIGPPDSEPESVMFGPDGNMYVSMFYSHTINRYNGTTGASMGVFVPAGSGGLSYPVDVAFGPDGNLYTNARYSGAVQSYDGSTGASLGDFVAPGSGGLNETFGLLWVPNSPGAKVPPTVSFTGAPSSAAYGAMFTVSATTNASTTATISASGACSISGTTVTMISGTGTCSLTANWAADANYTAATLSQTTNATLATPSVTFSGAPSSAAYGAAFAVMAATNASTTASLGATGACSISGTTVTMTSGAGTCSLTATWAADSNYSAASASQSTAATKATTTTSIASTQNQQLVNKPITLTATVTGQFGGAAAGSVTFKDGTAIMLIVPLNGSNQASVTISFATTGTRSITAVYAGDGNDIGSTTAPFSQSVIAKFKTTITLTSTPNPAYVGQAVTFKATVSSLGGAPPDGEIVEFTDGISNVLASVPLAGGSASFTSTTLTLGNDPIKASYGGDSSFSAIVSLPLPQITNKYPISTVLTSSLNPSIYGQSVTLTSTLTSTLGGPIPTGTVTFRNGSNTLGVGTLSGGVASLASTTLPAGSLPILATYNGDASSAASSASLTQFVTPVATGTTVISSINPSVFGKSVKFTATVTSGTVTPTGTVTFQYGTTTLGTVTLAGGKASLSTVTLPKGANTITATYNGTANITGSSGTVIQQVN